VYADKDNNLWLDEARTQPLPVPLYQAAGELGSYFLDEDLTTAVQMHGKFQGYYALVDDITIATYQNMFLKYSNAI